MSDFVHLHLHTEYSLLDGACRLSEIPKRAKELGQSAVAITDHGNVQGFPEAMLASEKCDMKVIYGMEAYFVNDTAGASAGKISGISLNDEMVVFDIETTGLSVEDCKIIEIGAVKVSNGEIVDRYSTFVKPDSVISAEITELTSITNEDVSDARKISEVLPEFLAFCGQALLVAHNADFDVGFVRAAANKLGIKFNSPYLDTVGLSRFLNTDLKSHKLDVLAKYYGLGNFNHHRAVDDAEMLTMIYFSMVKKMQQFDIQEFSALIKDTQSLNVPLLIFVKAEYCSVTPFL
jgi:DNA polymerase-3 subunit alpha (Gram-positive type)